MIYYIFYRIGFFLAMVLPLRVGYFIACVIGDAQRLFSEADRRAVIDNLKVVLNGDEQQLMPVVKQVFRDFAKYLVDFFRFSKLNDEFIKKKVKIVGLENVDKALSYGKGVIALSAHIGNFELGGAALSWAGYPLNAVVMRHQNKRIDDFFLKQRSFGKVNVIPIGFGLRRCFSVLKQNGLIALLGDRDFSANGVVVDFFERPVPMPPGPALLSQKMGSAIVPCFMIREPDDTFRFVLEEPILPNPGDEKEESVKKLMRAYIVTIEKYVKRYPGQWYMFRGVWNGGKDMRPNAII